MKIIKTFESFINEAKDTDVVAIAITYGGKKTEYTRAEIHEFLDDAEMYWSADNLPKWLSLSNYGGRSRKTSKRQEDVTSLLKDLSTSTGKPKTLDVQTY